MKTEHKTPEQQAREWVDNFLSGPHTYNLRNFLIDAFLAGRDSGATPLAAPSRRLPLPPDSRVARKGVFARVMYDDGGLTITVWVEDLSVPQKVAVWEWRDDITVLVLARRKI